MLPRISERVYLDIFKSVSNGNNRIPLKIALNKLNSFFNSPENPYKKYMCNDSTGIIKSNTCTIINSFKN